MLKAELLKQKFHSHSVPAEPSTIQKNIRLQRLQGKCYANHNVEVNSMY